jgi:peptidoglycan/xylan/chitin deacetylase (PgdA/CDA1 family)
MDIESEQSSGLAERRARRAERDARIRRRRRRGLAVGGLLAVLALAVGLVVASGGSRGPTSDGPSHETATNGAGRGVPGGSSGHDLHAGPSISPAAAATGALGTRSVPILMYHVINEPPPGAPFPGLYVSASEFSEQMHALAVAGFHAVTMDQMLAYWRTGTPLPPGRPIVLSFDNGYQSQYSNALPVLRSLGWVGVENLQLTGLPPSQGGLSQAQVRALVAAGWELDTQGFSHADLITLSPEALHYQVAVAREVLERRYGVPVKWFCYPSGHYNQAVIDMVKQAGYAGSTTVVPGWARPGEDPYRLPRLRVLGGTAGQTLLSEISAIKDDGRPPPSYGSS